MTSSRAGARVGDDPLIGRTLDRYTFVERLGSGAMGRVYLARHAILAREYAIKVLPTELAESPTFVERFRREAITLSRIHHPNVVPVVDFVALPSGVVFLVMERILGRTLAREMESEAPFTLARAGAIARQIAFGLAAAHRLGFVHRDVKPANVMLAKSPQKAELAMLLDFGIVGYAEPTRAPRITEEGSTLGTATYMAPEQALDANVGPSADLYSLGVILYEMLTGESPFVDEEDATRKAWTKPPMLPSAGGLERIVDHLLAPSPTDRPVSAETLLWELDCVLPTLGGARLERARRGTRVRREPRALDSAPTRSERPGGIS